MFIYPIYIYITCYIVYNMQGMLTKLDPALLRSAASDRSKTGRGRHACKGGVPLGDPTGGGEAGAPAIHSKLQKIMSLYDFHMILNGFSSIWYGLLYDLAMILYDSSLICIWFSCFFYMILYYVWMPLYDFSMFWVWLYMIFIGFLYDFIWCSYDVYMILCDFPMIFVCVYMIFIWFYMISHDLQWFFYDLYIVYIIFICVWCDLIWFLNTRSSYNHHISFNMYIYIYWSYI